MRKNSGIELLRIVLMLMIIIGHLFCHTGIRNELDMFSVKWIFVWGVQTITVAAVNCFVLLTGYFMVYSEVKINKILQLWGNVLFFSITIFLSLTILGIVPFTLKSCIDSFFPVLRSEYWFFTCYILLYLLIPLLNAGIRQMEKKQLKYIILVIICFFYVLPVFSAVFHQYDPEEGMSILGFITLYIIGAGLRKLDIKANAGICWILLLFNNLVVFLSKVALEIIVMKMNLNVGTGLFYHYNTIFQLVNAILLIMLFRNIKIAGRAKSAISFFAESTFSVYLIHEHPLVRQLLWQSGLEVIMLEITVWMFIVLSGLITAGVYIVAVFINRIRLALCRLFCKTKVGAIISEKANGFAQKLQIIIE